MSDSSGMTESEMEASAPRNFFSRLGGVYFSPGNTFRAIGHDPRVLVPIIVMIVIGFLQGFYLSQFIDSETARSAMGPQGQLPPEQAQGLIVVIKAMTIVSAGIGGVLVALIISGVFLLISKIISKENSFKAVFAVTVYTFMALSIVQFVVMVLVFTLKGQAALDLQNMSNILSSSLGAILAGLFGEDILPKFLMKLASAVEFFAIWHIVLLSIGYAAVTKKLKTSSVATWLVILYGIFALISAGISSVAG